MKLLLRLSVLLTLFLFAPQVTHGQFLKKLTNKAKAKIEREAENRSERRVNKKIDEEFDKAEDAIDGKEEENTTGTTKQNGTQSGSSENDAEDVGLQESKGPNVVWNKFDYVPGDTVLFEDGPSTDEENGEFPSRWDLYKGNAEIGNVDGENVIMFLSHQSYIIPYLKNSNEDYLPDVFTVELDVWFAKGYTTANRLWIYLSDQKNNRQKTERLVVMPHALSFMDSEKSYPGTENIGWSNEKRGSWKHISIAYTKGKFKAYFNDTRLINVPHLEINPSGITIEAGNDNMYIKNVRIAKGGVKYYDRVLSDGKIVVNGIKFDTNKATLKPESMGPINEIYQLLVDNPTINFSVEGHTDSDGGDDTNMALSKARGKTVMNKLVAMGIASNRLKSTGFGESKPIDNNSTPEGKANNRRVEFVKFSGNSNNTSNSSNNSTFDQLDKKTIGAKLESLPDSFNIPMSNNSGIVNGPGTVIIYATTDGNMGKMQILDIDKNDNNKLIIKYVTYNYNGSVHSQSDNLEIRGTFTCDLDSGNEGVERDKADFRNGGEILYPYETTILKVLK
ncbi:OmpA family protein [Maribacter polysiphoniae]|uniref:OmpA family protein n=1 Tax=Maribacter polysiphoniae TaxID=429344 RepID=A0A316E399_9FLAO|nr:OmpA family protein [Maribacter polysiphoniae]MBD1259372.1 OmpA family protein [Maribacter polysiphoniae]PWK24934.1 OmpA family protein [Maribacter polysiphoniae]